MPTSARALRRSTLTQVRRDRAHVAHTSSEARTPTSKVVGGVPRGLLTSRRWVAESARRLTGTAADRRARRRGREPRTDQRETAKYAKAHAQPGELTIRDQCSRRESVSQPVPFLSLLRTEPSAPGWLRRAAPSRAERRDATKTAGGRRTAAAATLVCGSRSDRPASTFAGAHPLRHVGSGGRGLGHAS